MSDHCNIPDKICMESLCNAQLAEDSKSKHLKFSNKLVLNILVYLKFLNGTGLEDDSEFFSLDRIF